MAHKLDNLVRTIAKNELVGSDFQPFRGLLFEVKEIAVWIKIDAFDGAFHGG